MSVGGIRLVIETEGEGGGLMALTYLLVSNPSKE